ncbi:hypothetical protein HDU93_008553 [Gonapodya sp. JEL0774]|nr:hypothetical protein HDU93_008553 [Gonapodya sp. JEL0774]
MTQLTEKTNSSELIQADKVQRSSAEVVIDVFTQAFQTASDKLLETVAVANRNLQAAFMLDSASRKVKNTIRDAEARTGKKLYIVLGPYQTHGPVPPHRPETLTTATAEPGMVEAAESMAATMGPNLAIPTIFVCLKEIVRAPCEVHTTLKELTDKFRHTKL